MFGLVNRKNKINIADYSYKKDIANRLFLTELSSKHVEVLQELLFLPTRCLVSDLAKQVSCTAAELDAIIESFCTIGLASRHEETLLIDKELRKYFEFHLEKFTDNFEPSFE